jgi:hypothetical protein
MPGIASSAERTSTRTGSDVDRRSTATLFAAEVAVQVLGGDIAVIRRPHWSVEMSQSSVAPLLLKAFCNVEVGGVMKLIKRFGNDATHTAACQ